ncbi:MAG TPA: glycosyltransferase [Candidatus Acidoferrales bacterium]|nr:glycosyltransferase [Candidatus Acidoferrales bacterium]
MDSGRSGGGTDLGRPTLSIIIPVYNEGENIATALAGIRDQVSKANLEILVVYDFEEDSTLPVVQRLLPEMPEVRLHRNDLGRGALRAIRSGFGAARGDHLLVMMADLSDDPADIDVMVGLAAAGADVVAGSRYMRGGHQIGGPLVKRTLSRVAGLTLHWIGGIPTHDSTSNFKLYSRRLLESVSIESEAGFELALELTVKAYLGGMTIVEVPTTWRDRTAGESRFQTRKWLPHYLRWYRVGMLHRLRRR